MSRIKLILAVCIMLIMIHNSSASSESLGELKEKGLYIIEEQSFVTNFESWGKVKFISGVMDEKMLFFIVDQEGSILYQLPEFSGNDWFFHEILAISFKDVNNDKLKDIIIIADVITGVGREGAIPFPICNIYFQQKGEFKRINTLDDQINDASKNKDIKMVLEFTKDKVDYINKLLENTK